MKVQGYIYLYNQDGLCKKSNTKPAITPSRLLNQFFLFSPVCWAETRKQRAVGQLFRLSQNNINNIIFLELQSSLVFTIARSGTFMWKDISYILGTKANIADVARHEARSKSKKKTLYINSELVYAKSGVRLFINIGCCGTKINKQILITILMQNKPV